MENKTSLLENNYHLLEKHFLSLLKPRKKRETQSVAQLETLKRGREKLAEKRQKQRDTKKQAPVNDVINKLDTKYSQLLEQLESRFQTVPVHKPTPAPSPIKTRQPRIFV